MSITQPSEVAANLGRPITTAETAQIELWIGWSEATVARPLRALCNLDKSTLRMVVFAGVTRRVRMPEPLTQVSTSVDDGSVAKTYARSSGLIEILPEWWEALGWVASSAFTVTPYGAPDAR